MKKLLLAGIFGLFTINSFAADAVKTEPGEQAAVNKHAKHTVAPHKKESSKALQKKSAEKDEANQTK